MKLLRPTDLDAALALLADPECGVVPLAGGTDLLVHWPENLAAHDRTYLDLTALTDLRAHDWSDAYLSLGALTTFWDVIRDQRAGGEFPLLTAAARTVGAIQIQSRGTWAGNIANGSPAADGVPVLMAYDAELELRSSERSPRWIPLVDYYTGYRQSVRRPQELITAIRVPRRRYDFEHFEKVGSREAQAIAKVGLAVTRRGDDWRVVVSSMAPTVRRCRSLESLLRSGAALASPADLLAPIRQDLAPIDDIRSTASYREITLSRILFFALNPA